MELTILGTDRAQCDRLQHEARLALRHLHQRMAIHQVQDRAQIAHFKIQRQPALLIDATVVAAGFIPSAAEIEAMVLARQAPNEKSQAKFRPGSPQLGPRVEGGWSPRRSC